MFFSIKIYHTACFFQAQETVLSAIGGCSVEQGRVLRRVRCGSVPLYTTKPAQAQGSRLPAMRHRSLNNFHKKWDYNNLFCLTGTNVTQVHGVVMPQHCTFAEMIHTAADFRSLRSRQAFFCSLEPAAEIPIFAASVESISDCRK